MDDKDTPVGSMLSNLENALEPHLDIIRGLLGELAALVEPHRDPYRPDLIHWVYKGNQEDWPRYFEGIYKDLRTAVKNQVEPCEHTARACGEPFCVSPYHNIPISDPKYGSHLSAEATKWLNMAYKVKTKKQREDNALAIDAVERLLEQGVADPVKLALAWRQHRGDMTPKSPSLLLKHTGMKPSKVLTDVWHQVCELDNDEQALADELQGFDLDTQMAMYLKKGYTTLSPFCRATRSTVDEATKAKHRANITLDSNYEAYQAAKTTVGSHSDRIKAYIAAGGDMTPKSAHKYAAGVGMPFNGGLDIAWKRERTDYMAARTA